MLSLNNRNIGFRYASLQITRQGAITQLWAIKPNLQYPLESETPQLAIKHLQKFSSSYSTAIGHQALRLATGNQNVGVGMQALSNTSTGFANAVLGTQASVSNTTGVGNTVMGYQASYHNTTGSDNVFWVELPDIMLLETKTSWLEVMLVFSFLEAFPDLSLLDIRRVLNETSDNRLTLKILFSSYPLIYGSLTMILCVSIGSIH